MTKEINLSKRAFLSRFSHSTKELIQPKIESTPREAARPPRAIDEALFIRTCNGCGECQSVCQASVIEIHNGLAQLNMDYNDCILCDACSNACSVKALNHNEILQTAFRPSFLTNCQNYLSQACSLCQSACPKKAIGISEDELPEANLCL